MTLAPVLMFLILIAAAHAEAANRYVRQGATGTSCTDWTTANACPSLSAGQAAAVRGDTIYIATGTYPGATLNKPTSGTTLITIKKATIADHGTPTGWSDALGTGTALFTSQVGFATSHWVFDGQMGGGPTNWYGPFGFKVQVTAASPAVFIGVINNWNVSVTNVALRHLEIQGNLNAAGGGSVAQDGIGAGWGRSSGSISHFYIHDVGRTIMWLTISNFTVEYGVTGRYNATSAQHSEIVSLVGSVTGQFIWRYNLVTSVDPFPNTGGIMIDSQAGGSAHVYGNIFWQDPALGPWNSTNGGVINGWCGCPGNGETFRNVFVYNNSFVNIAASSNPTAPLGNSPANHSNVNARNNLYYSVFSPGGGATWNVNSHNHFISTPTTGTSLTTGTGDPFVNLAGLDFRLTANTPPGVDVGAGPTGCTGGVNCYNVDLYGRTRSTWTRGAAEFGDGVPAPTPTPAPPGAPSLL